MRAVSNTIQEPKNVYKKQQDYVQLMYLCCCSMPRHTINKSIYIYNIELVQVGLGTTENNLRGDADKDRLRRRSSTSLLGSSC